MDSLANPYSVSSSVPLSSIRQNGDKSYQIPSGQVLYGTNQPGGYPSTLRVPQQQYVTTSPSNYRCITTVPPQNHVGRFNQSEYTLQNTKGTPPISRAAFQNLPDTTVKYSLPPPPSRTYQLTVNANFSPASSRSIPAPLTSPAASSFPPVDIGLPVLTKGETTPQPISHSPLERNIVNSLTPLSPSLDKSPAALVQTEAARLPYFQQRSCFSPLPSSSFSRPSPFPAPLTTMDPLHSPAYMNPAKADACVIEGGQYMIPSAHAAYHQEYDVKDREKPLPPPHKYVSGRSPLYFGQPFSDSCDPGVVAVSNALFSGSTAFQAIPIGPRQVFRRRKRGDVVPEWSNAFVSRVDPCECNHPEETYTPYEISRYRDYMGNQKTQLDFTPSHSVQTGSY